MKIYTEEHRKFFLDYVPGHTCAEVAEEFNRRFDIKITAAKVHSYKTNHKIRSGTLRGIPKGTGLVFLPEVCEFLRNNNTGKTAAEMAELLNNMFGTKYTKDQVKAVRARMHIKSGLTGHFEKGHVPANKGKKGVYSKGAEKGWFKKGHVPHNKAYIGDEAWTTDGYLKVKIAEPNVWRFKHIMEWEKHNGKVPDGYCISFKDGDHCNCNIENLICITKAENSVMNAQKLRSSSPEITETGVTLAKLNILISEIQREKTKNAYDAS